MAKSKTQYVCQSCGYDTAKWMGKCPSCNEWNSLSEVRISKASVKREAEGLYNLTTQEPVAIDDISLEKTPRYKTRLEELDRVLGGGLVPGSMVLLGGDPGIGKSTLVLDSLDQLALNDISVLYVTGEESKEQIKMRADRLNVHGRILVVAENSLDNILAHAEKVKPQVMVVDSIQTVYLPHLESAPGSISQVRECTGKLLYFSKTSLTTTLLVGHVTKEGSIAGPRVLEHMVDTVLYFEGENSGQFRILRTMKNRFGSTNEIGVFEMTSEGLKEVTNPSSYFLQTDTENNTGRCITASVEGTRPILTEIQALVSHSHLANPRRTAIGLDHNRVSLIVAVLEKSTGLNLFDQDIYVNVAGGLKLSEPASDVAVLLALVSSFKNKELPPQLLALGEIGLNGEIRSVGLIDVRIQEAIKLGYKTLILPKRAKYSVKEKGIEILKFNSIGEIIDQLF